MSSKKKNIILWVIAIIMTIGLVIYQRSTDPSFPIVGKITIDDEVIKYKLIRTFGGDKDALIEIFTDSKDITGSITQKRHKSYDDWSTSEMKRKRGRLVGVIPNQPLAGKVEYLIILHNNNMDYVLTEGPVIIRFKGEVPMVILTPRIFFMFFSLLFALRVGLELFFRGVDTKYLTGVVIITLFLGGIILGPIVQKFAFGVYRTGLPFGHDLTDNITLFVFIFWVIAWFVLRKKPQNRFWPLIAVIAMIVFYSIPQIILGPEIGHAKDVKQNIETIKN